MSIDPFGLDYDDSDGCEFDIDRGYRADQSSINVSVGARDASAPSESVAPRPDQTTKCRRCPDPEFRAGLCEAHWESSVFDEEDLGYE